MAGSEVRDPSRVVRRKLRIGEVGDGDGVRGVFGGLGVMRKVSVAMRWGWRGRGLVKGCRRLEYGFAICLSWEEKKKNWQKKNSEWRGCLEVAM